MSLQEIAKHGLLIIIFLKILMSVMQRGSLVLWFVSPQDVVQRCQNLEVTLNFL